MVDWGSSNMAAMRKQEPTRPQGKQPRPHSLLSDCARLKDGVTGRDEPVNKRHSRLFMVKLQGEAGVH